MCALPATRPRRAPRSSSGCLVVAPRLSPHRRQGENRRRAAFTSADGQSHRARDHDAISFDRIMIRAGPIWGGPLTLTILHTALTRGLFFATLDGLTWP